MLLDNLNHSSKNILYSIILPCYNEADNLPFLIEEYEQALKKLNISNINECIFELILVNNGSTDSSKDVIDKLSKKYNFLNVVNIDINIGYGNGIYKGLLKAKGDFVGWSHADFQTSPADVLKAFIMISLESDPTSTFIKGRRINRSFYDAFFTFGMSFISTILFGRKLFDINAQPNIFHKSLFMKLPNPPNDFSFDLYYYSMAKLNKIKVLRFDVFFNERLFGSSKWNFNVFSKLKFIRRTIRFMIKLKIRLLSKSFT